MDGGAWWAAVHGVPKSQIRLSDFTFTFHLHALEKEMATHSSVLAWRIPGTGEPHGLPSMGSPQSRTRLKQLSSSSSPLLMSLQTGFPGGSDGKESIYNAGDLGSITGLGRCPGGGHDNPLHDSRRAWWATVHGVAKSQT